MKELGFLPTPPVPQAQNPQMGLPIGLHWVLAPGMSSGGYGHHHPPRTTRLGAPWTPLLSFHQQPIRN